ncbi:MAG: hypothetical protein RID53_24110 [Coleofasciculus sp. B1-GNL1-01]|uniref:hypothetical protein n=1 Tax=Coleofasciculus sp. B1-GNL1-01 TaxID=3068484 RepID=UPI0033019490
MSVAKNTTATNWYVVKSQRDLMSAIAQLRQVLISRIEQRQGKEKEPIAIAPPEEEEDAPPSALTQLCHIAKIARWRSLFRRNVSRYFGKCYMGTVFEVLERSSPYGVRL